jgi:hypothetical protein
VRGRFYSIRYSPFAIRNGDGRDKPGTGTPLKRP